MHAPIAEVACQTSEDHREQIARAPLTEAVRERMEKALEVIGIEHAHRRRTIAGDAAGGSRCQATADIDRRFVAIVMEVSLNDQCEFRRCICTELAVTDTPRQIC